MRVVKKLYHGFPTCTGVNPLAKARGLSPGTGGKTMVLTITQTMAARVL